jgi:hypothetical protein
MARCRATRRDQLVKARGVELMLRHVCRRVSIVVPFADWASGAA